ncbi:MAG: microcystin-dependent protein [Salibacteraceae bacterium]|jgi:microcystin-dependent protein
MTPFIGQIQPWGFDFAPRGWALCDGQLMSIAQNTALFSLLGTIYGGDGRTTFALPDLRGRTALHMGTGPGLTTRPIGQRSGVEHNTLQTTQMPAHNHIGTGKLKVNTSASSADPVGNYPAGLSGRDSGGQPVSLSGYNTTASANGAADGVEVTTSNTGGGQSVNNMQPYLVVNWCIALVGIFPSRS